MRIAQFVHGLLLMAGLGTVGTRYFPQRYTYDDVDIG